MCMDVVSELSYHEYVEAIQRDLTKTHSGDHRNDGTLRIYPVHMIWNETGNTSPASPLSFAFHHPLCLWTAVFCGSNRYTTTIKIDYHNGE